MTLQILDNSIRYTSSIITGYLSITIQLFKLQLIILHNRVTEQMEAESRTDNIAKYIKQKEKYKVQDPVQKIFIDEKNVAA